MVNAGRVLDCLAASYRLDLNGEEYVRLLAEQAAPALDQGLGVMVYTYDARAPARPTIENFAASQRFDPNWLSAFREAVESAGVDIGSPRYPTGFRAWGHLVCGQASAVSTMRPFMPHFARLGGARDYFAVNALDASGQGLWIGAPLPSVEQVPPDHVTLFSRFAAHLTAAARLRRRGSTTPFHPSAVLSPNGDLLHADENAQDDIVGARAQLRRATLAFEQARTKKMRGQVNLATWHWRPLVLSRWSLLDDFDSGGRRFVIAVDNGPPTRPPRNDLSEREHQVLTQAHLGHTIKVIAYELGLSVSTVRVLLHRAARKLGASTRQELLAKFEALTKQHSREESQELRARESSC